MPNAVGTVAIKRFAVPVLLLAALVLAVAFAGSSAAATDRGQVSPTLQYRASGTAATWIVTIPGNVSPVAMRVSFGDGTSRNYCLVAGCHPSGGWTGSGSRYTFHHVFHVSCTSHAIHTFTQRWQIWPDLLRTTKVNVAYTGPLCG
jgi:hypothetical protein